MVSLGLIDGVDREAAVVWRGPKKQATIEMLLQDVDWAESEILVIDTPPGTSDEHISLVKHFRANPTLMEKTSALLVTTPQRASLQDVEREINFCQKTGIKIAGIVENMSGFICPNCNDCTDLFSRGTNDHKPEVTN